MINFIRIHAVFKKQLKDTLKNKGVFIQFIIFPVIAFIMTQTITTGNSGIPHNYFAVLFATMYAGMVPMINMASILTEEKEKNTLRVLMMANVKPVEYLVGVGTYIFLICSMGILVFGLIGGYGGTMLLKFVLIMMLGILVSIIMGSVVGIMVKNQMSATAIGMPIAMVAAFLPMISMFNKSIEAFSRIIYTQQINYIINDLATSKMPYDKLLIICCNMAVLFVIFILAYKNKSLAE